MSLFFFVLPGGGLFTVNVSKGFSTNNSWFWYLRGRFEKSALICLLNQNIAASESDRNSNFVTFSHSPPPQTHTYVRNASWIPERILLPVTEYKFKDYINSRNFLSPFYYCEGNDNHLPVPMDVTTFRFG
jgi:hypothetical protein